MLGAGFRAHTFSTLLHIKIGLKRFLWNAWSASQEGVNEYKFNFNKNEEMRLC